MQNKGLIYGSLLFAALLFAFDYSEKKLKVSEPIKPTIKAKKVIL